jgi:hypothetical protein
VQIGAIKYGARSMAEWPKVGNSCMVKTPFTGERPKSVQNRLRWEIPCKIIALHMQRRSSCTATNPILQRDTSAYIGSMIPANAGEGTKPCCYL